MEHLDRIAPPSAAEFVARYVKPSRPVILRGAIDDWPAMTLWSREYFKRRFGDREVPVVRSKGGQFYDPKTGMHYETIRVGDYVDLLEPGTPIDLYIVLRVHEALPELFGDVIPPAYCRDAAWTRSKLFFSGPDAKGLMHRDLPENLYAQIVGRKRFILLDRRHTRMVHRYSLLSGVPNFSPVDPEDPDYTRFPRLRGAPLMVADLEPGDLLYIPSLWWHQVHSVDVSVSISLWWARGPMVGVVKAAELFMRLRDLRL